MDGPFVDRIEYLHIGKTVLVNAKLPHGNSPTIATLLVTIIFIITILHHSLVPFLSIPPSSSSLVAYLSI